MIEFELGFLIVIEKVDFTLWLLFTPLFKFESLFFLFGDKLDEIISFILLFIFFLVYK